MSQNQITQPSAAPAPAQAAPRLSDLVRQQQDIKEGDATARRILNSLSVTSELMAALIQHPGPNSSHDAMVVAARAMLVSAESTTQTLVDELSLGVFPWAKYRVMRVVSKVVADRWCQTSRATDGKSPSADVTDLIPVWKEIAAHAFPDIVHEDPADDTRASNMVALLDAMQPVMQSIGMFSMFHDPESAASSARDLILGMADGSLTTLASDPMSNRSRLLLMQELLRSGGDLYAAAWRRHAEDTIEELKAMTHDQQRSVIASNPEGLPLKPIEQTFITTFGKLVEMVAYVAKPKAAKVADKAAAQPAGQARAATGVASGTVEATESPESIVGSTLSTSAGPGSQSDLDRADALNRQSAT